MSTKKRFSIPQDLARGIRNSVQSASINQGQMHFDMMGLEVLEPDENNPRQLSISRDEILWGLQSQDENYQTKLKELEALKELAESIRKIGIKNPIEVYKNGSIYKIITGERRYWAALLAEQKTVPVRISQKPDEFNLRYTQWVENINRKDLSLWEKYNNLQLIANAYQGEFTEANLQTLLGVSNIQAYRYYNLLKADEKIIQLLQLGKLNNLKLVQELVSMKDKSARNQIVAWISASKDEVTSLSAYREVAGKKPLASKKHPSIRLGSINNHDVAKQLLDIVLSDSRFTKHQIRFNSIDWTSSKSIAKAFKDLFKTMEKEFNVKEMV